MEFNSPVQRVLLPEQEVLDAHDLLQQVRDVDGELCAAVDHVHGAVLRHLFLDDFRFLHHGDL